MIVRAGLDEDSSLPPNVTGAAVTVGTFDGVHRGHLDLIGRLVRRARELTLPSLAVTFDPHPLVVVNPAAAPPLLTVGDEKLEVLAETGLDYLAVVSFTPALAALSAEEFVTRVLCNRFHMRDLLIGHDHGLGRERAGTAEVLTGLGQRHGFAVGVVDPVSALDGRWISSTVIRRAVAGGDLAHAADFLGRPYSIAGTVVPGAQRGRALGVPTLNLSAPPERKLLPPDGVYAVRVQTPKGAFDGMMSLGGRPTFDDDTRMLEVHLLDASGDFYGQRVRVDVVKRLREIRRFSTPEALVARIHEDEVAARCALTADAAQRNLRG